MNLCEAQSSAQEIIQESHKLKAVHSRTLIVANYLTNMIRNLRRYVAGKLFRALFAILIIVLPTKCPNAISEKYPVPIQSRRGKKIVVENRFIHTNLTQKNVRSGKWKTFSTHNYRAFKWKIDPHTSLAPAESVVVVSRCMLLLLFFVGTLFKRAYRDPKSLLYQIGFG